MQAKIKYGRLDILVNSAGVALAPACLHPMIHEIDEYVWNIIMQINAMSVLAADTRSSDPSTWRSGLGDRG
ncbi:hypothetical protein N7495_000968 [Penicillium taxi]|uniref:uncharacterized protein n=1 Tax=Penicillium taxi TaxID=168475 RepID=UPI002544F918|nr:uncharacterized protein N7495_000968 [Penicillium taxi]KAJ5908286.1 hypothetical protein N7495_000968 [Penicillium taxi]